MRRRMGDCQQQRKRPALSTLSVVAKRRSKPRRWRQGRSDCGPGKACAARCWRQTSSFPSSDENYGGTPMTTPEQEQFVKRAEEVYGVHLKSQLERTHPDYFVAIEPESGDYFLGRSMSEATEAARRTYPDRLTHLMRVGHRAAVHIGRSCS